MSRDAVADGPVADDAGTSRNAVDMNANSTANNTPMHAASGAEDTPNDTTTTPTPDPAIEVDHGRDTRNMEHDEDHENDNEVTNTNHNMGTDDVDTRRSDSGAAERNADGAAELDFQCNICFERAADPVITRCGHLYCWPCLYMWLSSRNAARDSCPVCKALVDRTQLIPIYTNSRKTNPADTVPSRPVAEQPPPPPPRSAFRTALFGDFAFHFGVAGGAAGRPFAARRAPAAAHGGIAGDSDDTADFAAKLFMMIAVMLVVTIVLG